MAPVVPDPKKIRTFKDAAAFAAWLEKNHDRETELWIKIHKKASGLASITPLEAIDVVLCWGWIDGQRKGFDERSYLQRYTPRTKRSPWSRINRDNVARLIAEGRMTPHGLREVEAAKADGRWDAAYAPSRLVTVDSLPDDLRAAVDADARAKQALAHLGKADLFSLVYRTNNMKTPAGRRKKIDELVAKLARGEPIAPRRTSP